MVEASIGHIMDLPKNDIGVELKKRTFEPTLIVSPGKEKVVERLKKLASKADMVYLAPDPDREGEAIAAHLSIQLLPMMKDKSKVRRVTFNEITKKAVQAAFLQARDIDEDLVDAQQTRRVLDRLVATRSLLSCGTRFVVAYRLGESRPLHFASSSSANRRSTTSSQSNTGRSTRNWSRLQQTELHRAIRRRQRRARTRRQRKR